MFSACIKLNKIPSKVNLLQNLNLYRLLWKKHFVLGVSYILIKSLYGSFKLIRLKG